jgi:hypothetical protein
LKLWSQTISGLPESVTFQYWEETRLPDAQRVEGIVHNFKNVRMPALKIEKARIIPLRKRSVADFHDRRIEFTLIEAGKTTLGKRGGILARENLESPEPVKGLDNFLWFGRNRDGVRFKAGAWSVAGFELAVEDEGGEGGVSFLAG